MQLISVLTALTAFKAATALPSGSTTDGKDLAKRAATFWVSLYVDEEYRGYNETITSETNECIKLGSKLTRQVSSIFINLSGIRIVKGICRFYWDSSCEENFGCNYFDLHAPGHRNLAQWRQGGCMGLPNLPGAQDKIQSYMCWEYGRPPGSEKSEE